MLPRASTRPNRELHLMLVEPVSHFHVRAGFVVAVALLDRAGQLFLFAADALEIVVRELAPLLLGFALQFMPFALKDITGCGRHA